MNEIEIINDVELPEPIVPNIPCDIKCKEFKYNMTNNKRHLVVECGDGSKINYPDITPYHIKWDNIDEDEFGNRYIVRFVREADNTVFNNFSFNVF